MKNQETNTIEITSYQQDLNFDDYFTFLKQNRIKDIMSYRGDDYGVSHPIYDSGRTSSSSYVKKIKGSIIKFEFVNNEYWNSNDSSIEWSKNREMITYVNGVEVDRDAILYNTLAEKALAMISFIKYRF